jgi:NTE family protein
LKIDYIGGTSMGSVVGGLYASGIPQLKFYFQSTNFDELISDFIPRSSKLYEKRNDELYALFCHSIKLEYQKHFLKGCIILIY